jgi:hypothetical protein
VDNPSPEPQVSQELPHNHENYGSLKSYFDISDPSDKTVGKFKSIYEYFRGDKGEYGDFDLLRDIKDTAFKLGTPALGETRLDQVHRYITLMARAKEIDNEMKAMTR